MLNGRHRLPSGFGTIRNLGAGRRKPYAVHPPATLSSSVTQTTETAVGEKSEPTVGEMSATMVGEKSEPTVDEKSVTMVGGRVWKRPKAICYVSSWEAGLKVLALYHAGMYKDGIEDLIDSSSSSVLPELDTKDLLCEYCQTVLDDIEKIKNGTYKPSSPVGSGDGESGTEKKSPTFKEAYASFWDYKYGPHANRKLKKSTENATAAAYKRFSSFYDRSLDSISVDDMQELVNGVADDGFSKSTVTRCVTLCHQLYKYAYPRELCSKETGKFVEMPACREEEHHQDFTDSELNVLWENKSDPVVRDVLVMCYSGYRVNEYADESFSIHGLQSAAGDGVDSVAFFQGGFKTDAGKDRIVPIHSGILEMVKGMNGVFFSGMCTDLFRDRMKEKMVEIGIDGKIVDGVERYHTPHSCRHTFSRLCESYGVREADRKRMLGHSFGNDVTNRVYGHRSVDELKGEIEKIKVCGHEK